MGFRLEFSLPLGFIPFKPARRLVGRRPTGYRRCRRRPTPAIGRLFDRLPGGLCGRNRGGKKTKINLASSLRSGLFPLDNSRKSEKIVLALLPFFELCFAHVLFSLDFQFLIGGLQLPAEQSSVFAALSCLNDYAVVVKTT
jgi:hypothetical protein